MSEVSTGFTEVNGARLYYELAGEGEPVVLVAGFSLDTRMWDDQWQALTGRYRVLRYDARGFGRSSLPDGPYSPWRDLRALLERLGFERPHLVGLSMGGGIAIDYAVSHPEDLRSLTLIDPTLNGYEGFSPGLRRAMSFGEEARTNGLEAARQAWLAHPFFDAAQEKPAVAARLREIVAAYSGWHWLNRDEDAFRPLDPPAAERLAEISVPTLVIVGERDVEDFRLLAEVLAANIPDARLEVIPDAGHMANMEQPEIVNRLLLGFLNTTFS